MYQRHANARSSTSIISALHSDKPIRESRIHSIYEKYLYDPKDLQSEDPVIRQLARKHSQRQQHKRMSSAATKKRQSTVGFAKGTKEDGPSSAAANSNKPRNSTGSAYEGFGALMDEYSDSDDSDNEGSRPPRAGASQPSKAAPVRESWGARAMAVGERPPDSASQNPPTLKLLGLKSQREGGQALGRPANGASTLASPSYQRGRTPSPAFEMLSEETNSRAAPVARHGLNEQSVSEYGDGASRVGSTIDFTGQGSDGFGGGPVQHMQSHSPSQPHRRQEPSQQQAARSPPRGPAAALNGGLQPHSGAGAVNPRKALTAQLGLDTPMPPTNPTTPNNMQQGGDYFTSKNPGGGEVLLSREERFSPPRAPAEAMVRMPASSSSSFATSSSMEKSDPFGDASPPGRMLVAGPQGYGGPRSPGASPTKQGGHPQQGYGRAPPPALRAAGGVSMPMPQPNFSDSRQPPYQQQQPPQQQKRQSIFRRSMAFMTGSGGEPSMQQQQQPYDQQQQGPGAGNKRQSIFRRSMAFLSGRPGPPPPAAPQPVEEDQHAPPRNHGFDNEKDMRSRKSQYLGGGGQGDEWDVNGAGANFWRRFNEAQKHANPNDKMELTSKKFTQKATARQKMARWMAGLGGILIIAAVVGVVIWRESKASTDNASPGSINKSDFGGTKVMQRSMPTAVAGAAAAYVAARESDERDVWAAARVNEQHQGGAAAAAAAMPRSTAAAQVNKMQLVRRHKHLPAQRREMEEETQHL